MGTKLNKKNEKRKNINRIIVGTRYKKERNSPSPKGRGVITEIPRTYDDKAKTEWHRDIINAPTTDPVLNMS